VEGASSRWAWGVVREAVRTPEGLLVYLAKRSFVGVPAHAFASPEEAEAAYRIAAERAPRFRQAA